MSEDSKPKFQLTETDYLASNSGFYVRLNPGDETLHRLSNFHCKITKELILDGVNPTSNYSIWIGIPYGDENNIQYREERIIDVKSKDFHIGKWLHYLGSNYVVYPLPKGHSEKYICMVCQDWKSLDRVIMKVATQLGFREYNDKLIYVSGDIILGDTSGLEVKPPQEGMKFKYYLNLSSNITLQESFKNSLKFLELGSNKIVYPLYLAIWRSPMCYFRNFPSMITLCGKTGTFKSTIAAKALSHFGNFSTNLDLPIKWIDTFTSIQIQLSKIRDTLTVIDDFNPEHGKNLRDSMATTLSVILGDVSDGISRKRANSDLSMRDPFTCRTVVISTNEEIPDLPESRLARLLCINLDKNTKVYRDKLSDFDCTKNTLITKTYIEWIRKNPKLIVNLIEQNFIHHREIAQRKLEGKHQRAIDTYAELMIACDCFENFCLTHELSLPVEFREKCEQAILDNLRNQNVGFDEDVNLNVGESFLSDVSTLVMSNQAHLLPRYGKDSVLGNEYKTFFGWYDDNFVFLKIRNVIGVLNSIRYKAGITPLNERKVIEELVNVDKITKERVSRQIKLRAELNVRVSVFKYLDVFPTNLVG